jgi:hypothetical protein
MALLGPCGMSDLSPQGGAKRTFDQARAHLVMCESANYILTCQARIPSARVIVNGRRASRRRLQGWHRALRDGLLRLTS